MKKRRWIVVPVILRDIDAPKHLIPLPLERVHIRHESAVMRGGASRSILPLFVR